MFRSLSRITVAFVLVCAFLLSTVPAQAQPRDPGAGLTLDTSWFEAALGWLDSLLGGEEPEATGGTKTDIGGGGSVIVMSGPCIDPWGGSCIDG